MIVEEKQEYKVVVSAEGSDFTESYDDFRPKLLPSTFWSSLGSPRFVLGPMVDQSDLAFRILTRRYGTDLCYTPMLHSRLFVEQQGYRSNNFQTCIEDSPLIAQFCGHDASCIGAAAQMIATLAPNLNAIDINFGCPQRNVAITDRFCYKSQTLLSEQLKNPFTVRILVASRYTEFDCRSIVRDVVTHSPLPVTCKMRKVDAHDLQSTLNLARRLEAAGCCALCIHGRTKEEKGQSCREADWEVVSRMKQQLGIPVIANGGVETREDAIKCLEVTRADAVMSAEAILEYPALFDVRPKDIDQLMVEYLELAKIHKTHSSIIKAHLFHALYAGLQLNSDLRATLRVSKTIEEFQFVVNELKMRRSNVQHQDKFGWYSGNVRGVGLDRSGQLLMRSGTLDISETKMIQNEQLVQHKMNQEISQPAQNMQEKKLLSPLVFEEKEMDLFAMDTSWSLAHCVSADLRMGAGIAVGFRKKFRRVDELRRLNVTTGDVAVLQLPTRSIFYLVTKEKSSDKPTMETLTQSLRAMRSVIVRQMLQHPSKQYKLAIPRIGCGLDRLEWPAVRQRIKEVFFHDNIHVVVCVMDKSRHDTKRNRKPS